jgi:DNA-binding MarR family transcriptional regulator
MEVWHEHQGQPAAPDPARALDRPQTWLSHRPGDQTQLRRRAEVAEGTLYPVLHDLEKRGLIQAFEETVSGRLRRCYRLTEAGQRELATETAEWERYSQAVNFLLGGVS